jgi:hypothetical protein
MQLRCFPIYLELVRKTPHLKSFARLRKSQNLLSTFFSVFLSSPRSLKNHGYSFAIIQAWEGGYQFTSNLNACVKQAWAAGMAHVDVRFPRLLHVWDAFTLDSLCNL